jgi:hypothetical protein
MSPVPRLTIVIPFCDGEQQFEDTLVSVLQNRPADCEVLVVHPGIYDDPYNLKDEIQIISVARNSALPDLINVGFDRARGEVVHVLQCGLEVDEGWTDSPLEQFHDSSICAVSPSVVMQESGSLTNTAGVAYSTAGYRRHVSVGRRPGGRDAKPAPVLGPTLWAGFYRREPVQQVGGLDSSIGAWLVDVDLALRLKSLGLRAIFDPASQVYGSPTHPPLPNGLVAGRQLERLFWKHADRQGRLVSLCLHVTNVAAEIALAAFRPRLLSRLAGRGGACLSLLGGARSQRWSTTISSPATEPAGSQQTSAMRVECAGVDPNQRHVA